MSDFQSLILRDIKSKLTLINNNYFYYLKDDPSLSGDSNLSQNPYLGFQGVNPSEVDNLLSPYTSYGSSATTNQAGTRSFTTSYSVVSIDSGYLVVTTGGAPIDSSFSGLPVTFNAAIESPKIQANTTYYIDEIINNASSSSNLVKVSSINSGTNVPINLTTNGSLLSIVTMSINTATQSSIIVGMNMIVPTSSIVKTDSAGTRADFGNDKIYVNQFKKATGTLQAESIKNSNNNAIVLSVLNNENAKGSTTTTALAAVLAALKKVSGQTNDNNAALIGKSTAYSAIAQTTITTGANPQTIYNYNNTNTSVKTLIELATKATIQSQITNEASYTLSDYTPYYWNEGTGTKLNTLVNNETIRDVNCMGYYSDKSSVIKYVQALYAWHNLLIPANWNSFINGNKTVLKIPQPSANNNNSLTIEDLIIELNTVNYSITTSGTLTNGQDLITTIMPAIIPFNSILQVAKNINIYTIRRLFYMYIQIAQYCMAMGIVTQVYQIVKAATAPIPDDYQRVFNKVLIIPKVIIQTLKNIASNDSALSDLIAVTQRRVDEYSKSVNVITNLNTNINKGKIVLTNNQEKIKGQNETLKTIKKFELASIIVFSIVLAASCGLLVFPLEYSKKLIFGLVIVVIAIASSFTIGLLFNKANIKTFEKFAVTPQNITDDYTRFIGSQNNAFYGLISEYLTATISNTNALQTYNIYGNVNFALQKEHTYYNNTDKLLTNVNSRMSSIYKISFLDQMQRTALMNFLMSITVITAATIMAYVAVQDYQTLSKVVLGIGFTLILFALIIYILEVTQRVRTDGNKIYWGDLSNATKNDLGN